MMTEKHTTEMRKMVIALLRENGFERDAEMMDQESGSSTVAHMLILAALSGADIVNTPENL